LDLTLTHQSNFDCNFCKTDIWNICSCQEQNLSGRAWERGRKGLEIAGIYLDIWKELCFKSRK